MKKKEENHKAQATWQEGNKKTAKQRFSNTITAKAVFYYPFVKPPIYTFISLQPSEPHHSCAQYTSPWQWV